MQHLSVDIGTRAASFLNPLESPGTTSSQHIMADASKTKKQTTYFSNGQALSSPPLGVRISNIFDSAINFGALYLTTLFSLDPWAAAEGSTFNTSSGRARQRGAEGQDGRGGDGAEVHRAGGDKGHEDAGCGSKAGCKIEDNLPSIKGRLGPGEKHARLYMRVQQRLQCNQSPGPANAGRTQDRGICCLSLRRSPREGQFRLNFSLHDEWCALRPEENTGAWRLQLLATVP